MDTGKIEKYAQELFEAERARRTVTPISERDPSFGVDDAYAVQMANIKRALAMGHKISGKKIGLTSPGIQRQLGVNEPDYGHLFCAMDCGGDGRIDTGALIQPKIEAEIAFILKKDLRGGNVGVTDVINATDYVVAAFEIVDSRIADWRLTLQDTVADNASSGRYILGGAKIAIGAINLPSVAMKLYKITGGGGNSGGGNGGGGNGAGKNGASKGNGGGCVSGNGYKMELVAEGLGSAVMGNPIISVAWLANKLWRYGVALQAGEVVLSGAFSAAPAAKKGDVFKAAFDGIGGVEARFV